MCRRASLPDGISFVGRNQSAAGGRFRHSHFAIDNPGSLSYYSIMATEQAGFLRRTCKLTRKRAGHWAHMKDGGYAYL
jgi:hypothetical protein